MDLRDRRLRLQRWLGVTQDGILGTKTMLKLERVLGIVPWKLPGPTTTRLPRVAVDESVIPAGEFDSRTEAVIATLLPGVQVVFAELARKGARLGTENGCEYKLISGTRTYAEQDALYAHGRSGSGRRVTNARGGFSNHNFGIAADGGWFRGRKYLDESDPEEASKLHRALAMSVAHSPQCEILEWGGNWRSFEDEPHWNYKTGRSLAQLRAAVVRGERIV